jgi:hypothetical protein
MEPTAARTPPVAITPPQALTPAACQPRRPMAPKRWGRPITLTRGPMAQRIKVRTPIRTGEARRSRRTARLSTRSITRMLMVPLGEPRARMATGMRPRTATPTRTQEVAGRRQVLPMLHTVGETAVDRSSTAAHRHSVDGAILATPAGAAGLRAPGAGAAVAVVVAGAAGDSVGAAVVKLNDRSQAARETRATGGSECSTLSAIVRV